MNQVVPSSNTLTKIRLSSGNLAVYDVQPQHVGSHEAIRMYGKHIATQFNGTWMQVSQGAVQRLFDREAAKAIDAMPIDHEVPHPIYGMQIKIYDHAAKGKEWKWVHPTNGKPYRYHTTEEAERNLQMCYPQVSSAEKRVHIIEEALA